MKRGVIELRTSDAKRYDDVHVWLAEKLDLPTTYGRNLDALWDCLTGYIELPLTIIWINDNDSAIDYCAFTDLLEEASRESEQLSFSYGLDALSE